MKCLSRVQLLATLWTAAYQAPPSMGFSRQQYWSGVPLPSLWIILVFLKLKLALTWICGFLRDEQGQLCRAARSYRLQVVCIFIGRQCISLVNSVEEIALLGAVEVCTFRRGHIWANTWRLWVVCLSGENNGPGKADSKCKGPEAEVCLKCSDTKS